MLIGKKLDQTGVTATQLIPKKKYRESVLRIFFNSLSSSSSLSTWSYQDYLYLVFLIRTASLSSAPSRWMWIIFDLICMRKLGLCFKQNNFLTFSISGFDRSSIKFLVFFWFPTSFNLESCQIMWSELSSRYKHSISYCLWAMAFCGKLTCQLPDRTWLWVIDNRLTLSGWN